MADKLTLILENRTEKGKINRKIRAAGRVPAVVYGHGTKSQAVSASSRDLESIYASAGGNRIIGLKIDESRAKNALIHDVQYNVRTGQLSHVDFYVVRMDEKIKTMVPVNLVGESTAVYQQEGTLIRPLEAIEVEALPADLPEGFEVDIAVLDDFDKTITVGDLKVPNGVEILTPAEEMIAKVDPPRSEEELEADLNAPIDEAGEMPEGVQEDQEVVDEKQHTDKEPENKAAGADPSATK